jgi:hypothetical protein
MKLSKKIKLSTYNCNLHFIITDNLTREVNKVYKNYNMSEDFKDSAEGVVISLDIDDYTFILSNEYITHNTIAHEVYHVVVKVTEDRGVIDEEAQAWLAGYVTGEIYKFLQKKNLKITHGRG